MADGLAVAAVSVVVEPAMDGKMIPYWAKKIVRTEDLEKIENTILLAEKNTLGEIVPILVKSSTNVGHVQLSLSLLFFIVFIFFEHEFGYLVWDADRYYLVIPLFLIVFYFLAGFFSKFSFFQKLLTTNADQISDVQLRAEVEFYRGKYSQTKNRTAILLLISLMEKRVVVLADEAVVKKVPQETWLEVVQMITHGIAMGNFSQGLQLAIQKSGEILSKSIPLDGHKHNEISNKFIIKN